MSGQLTMYTTQWCGFCRNLKNQLARDGIEMAEVDIERLSELVLDAWRMRAPGELAAESDRDRAG